MSEHKSLAEALSKEERHGAFLMLLGARALGRYSDGGPGRKRDKRRAKAAKLARRKNRK